jgi:hypothetical protein
MRGFPEGRRSALPERRKRMPNANEITPRTIPKEPPLPPPKHRADEGRGAVRVIRCRLNGDGADTTWHNGQARPRAGAVQATLYNFERRRLSRYARGDRGEIEGAELEGAEREQGWQMFVCVPGIHCLQRRLQAAVRRRSVALVGSLRSNCDKVRCLGRFPGGVAPPERPCIEHGLEIWVPSFLAPPGYAEVFTVRAEMQDGRHRYFQYLRLPFGWSRSGYWFSRSVQRFWTMVKRRNGYRVLSYVDDFAVAPSQGRAASAEDCRKASRLLDSFLERYGLSRQSEKGVWSRGSQCLQHLGFMINTTKGLFGVPAKKLDAVSEMAHKLLGRARINRRVVPTNKLESLIGKSQILRLAMPDTAFRLRAHYDCVPKRSQSHGIALGSIDRQYHARVMTRLSHAALRDCSSGRTFQNSCITGPSGPRSSTDLHCAHRRIDDSLRRDVEPRSAFGWDSRLVREP